MAPVAAPDDLALQPLAATAAVLDGDEIVELSLRPSAWYMLFASGRVLLLAVLLGAAIAIGAQGSWNHASLTGLGAVLLLAIARIAWGSLQWASTRYLLTNRRVLSVRGVLAVETAAAPLDRISGIDLVLTNSQRVVRIGSIAMRTSETAAPLVWEHLARPADVYQRLVRAIRRGQSQP